MKTVTVHLPVSEAPAPEADARGVRRAAAQAAGLAQAEVSAVCLRKRSLDARRRSRPRWVLRVDVYDVHERPPDGSLPPLLRPARIARVDHRMQPIIVGMGPAGLFAALAFADHGVACTLVDRGSAVEGRNHHVRDLRRHGKLEPESNLCFGEGGAGTYSDGKLYTRSRKRRVREVYERLVALGISPRILVDAHPHVGTNRLIKMTPRLRAALQEAGHALRFDARVVNLVLRRVGHGTRVVGVRLADGREITGGPVLLATGHSARDTYRMLARRGVAMEAKPFAIGLRVEHPQELIDEVQLGPLSEHPDIGPAEYFVSQKVPRPDHGTRGVYSFCMCPGGYVLPTPTAAQHLNVNGMSNSNRGSGIANAALVAQVEPQDLYLERPGDLDDHPLYGRHQADGALLGLALQSVLEQRAYIAGGGGYRAPAQRLAELVQGGGPSLCSRSSYRPGLGAACLRELLPAGVAAALVQGARQVEQRQLRGFLSDEALALGVETTTSSPVRILRDRSLQSPTHPGLYPTAEGAGYAGGIVSSAIDGLRVAEQAMRAHSLDAPS